MLGVFAVVENSFHLDLLPVIQIFLVLLVSKTLGEVGQPFVELARLDASYTDDLLITGVVDML